MHALVPLLILFLFLIVGAVVGYVVYSIATDIASKTSKKMEDHNVSVGKDGLKIAVKEVKNEDYVDKTQNVLVNVWNLSTWPAYKSRFWNKEEPKKSKSKSGSGSRSAGSSPRLSASSSSSSSGRKHEHRTENGRLAEPRLTMRRTASGNSLPGSFD